MGSSAQRQWAAQQEPGGPWFRLHPPPSPSPGKEDSRGSPSRVAQTTGFPLDVHSTPRSVIPTAPTPDSGDTQQLLRTPWVLPVSHPLGMSLSKTALCPISFWGEADLLQEIFPIQGSNLHLLGLWHWQAGSLPLVPPWKGEGSQTSCQAPSTKKCPPPTPFPGAGSRVRVVAADRSRSGQPGLQPPGSGVGRRPKQTHPDSLPERFPALLPRVPEPQDGAPG